MIFAGETKKVAGIMDLEYYEERLDVLGGYAPATGAPPRDNDILPATCLVAMRIVHPREDGWRKRGHHFMVNRFCRKNVYFSSRTISIAFFGHSLAQMPQPLQKFRSIPRSSVITASGQ